MVVASFLFHLNFYTRTNCVIHNIVANSAVLGSIQVNVYVSVVIDHIVFYNRVNDCLVKPNAFLVAVKNSIASYNNVIITTY